MRILVDHSGYALLNIGDIAMLQACIHRLRTLWPDAVIHVFTESPDQLQRYCPEVSAVASTIVGRRSASVLPKSGQLAAEQMWKTAMPLLARSNGPAVSGGAAPLRVLDAVRRADLVVSSGGGFISDVFWWHGAGVLSVLAMAQRLGKPTAMFGQGLGPVTHPVLSHAVRLTMPRLTTIGLREQARSTSILRAHGVDLNRAEVTGDDALVLATPATRPRAGMSIGMNVRVASYSSVDTTLASQIVGVARAAAHSRSVATVALPVSRYGAQSDLRSVRTSVDGEPNGTDDEFADIRSPEELKASIARCRVVVTGSYHAAVFALAAGIPAVGITSSSYYDGKFEGLAALFPGGCQPIRIGPGFEQALTDAIDRAWNADDAMRDRIHAAARAQVARGDDLYARFKSLAAERVTGTNSPQVVVPTRAAHAVPTAEDLA
ncbi:polysaccharide pyruvyl transferase family protein [Mycobacterium aquaticum]|uniref:polysaccharide pyruvyl transferase family protein n=1 Tax=Mycobacterium aquaticum TaxID=1927124 RepID=UPI001301C6B4|nr:polysaccharide pyruvyl transferase family protein [Mycobacterium aquaticum]